MKQYKWTDFSFTGVERETSAVTNQVIAEFNKEFGTDVKPALTALPFKNDDMAMKK